MKCPYGENEMEQGYVSSNGARVLFSYQKTTLVYTPGEGEILLDKHHMGTYVEAYCCKKCRKIVIPYTE